MQGLDWQGIMLKGLALPWQMPNACKEDACFCLDTTGHPKSASSSRHQAAGNRVAGMQGHASVMQGTFR